MSTATAGDRHLHESTATAGDRHLHESTATAGARDGVDEMSSKLNGK